MKISPTAEIVCPLSGGPAFWSLLPQAILSHAWYQSSCFLFREKPTFSLALVCRSWLWPCVQLIWSMLFPGIHLWMELLDHILTLHSTFWETDNSYTILHSHSIWVQISPPLCQHLLLLCLLLIIVILVGIKLYLIVIFISISLITNGCWTAFHAFICHLYIFFGTFSTSV